MHGCWAVTRQFKDQHFLECRRRRIFQLAETLECGQQTGQSGRFPAQPRVPHDHDDSTLHKHQVHRVTNSGLYFWSDQTPSSVWIRFRKIFTKTPVERTNGLAPTGLVCDKFPSEQFDFHNEQDSPQQKPWICSCRTDANLLPTSDRQATELHLKAHVQ